MKKVGTFMDKQLKVVTLRMPLEFHKIIKIHVVDKDTTIRQYFIDLATEDLTKEGIEICQKK